MDAVVDREAAVDRPSDAVVECDAEQRPGHVVDGEQKAGAMECEWTQRSPSELSQLSPTRLSLVYIAPSCPVICQTHQVVVCISDVC